MLLQYLCIYSCLSTADLLPFEPPTHPTSPLSPLGHHRAPNRAPWAIEHSHELPILYMVVHRVSL